MRYKVLMMGCGNIAGRFDMERPVSAWPVTQAGAFRQHGGFELTACIDPNEWTRRAFALHWGIPRHAASIESLGAQPGEFDVISICSPTAFHHQNLETALKLMPRVIFCEKPLTPSVEQTDFWQRVCVQQGVCLVVNYTRQWDPSVQRIVEEVREGAWGAVRSAVGFYNKGVLNNGGHLIDLLLRLLGPISVVAATAPVFDHWEDDPTVAGLLISEQGNVPISLAPSHAKDYALFELELVCELGVIRMRSGGLKWDLRRTKANQHFNGYRDLSDAVAQDGEYLQAMTLAAKQIHDFLDHGWAPSSPGTNALAVQKICHRLRVAATQAAPSMTESSI